MVMTEDIAPRQRTFCQLHRDRAAFGETPVVAPAVAPAAVSRG
jgi:hypothetical protein